MTSQKLYDCIAEELDEVDLCDLPDDKEFAREIVRVLPPENAMEAIDAYTAYVCARTYGVIA